MPLFLNNQDQARAIDSKEAIDALEAALRQVAAGNAIRRPRIDNLIPTHRPDEFFSFSSMEGGFRDPGYYALRLKPDIISWPTIDGVRRRVTYNTEPGLYGGLVLLYSVQNAAFLAIMNDGFIQHLRVGATAALGVRYLARPDAEVIGMYGAGGMARSFALAFAVERRIKRIQAYSPNRRNLEAYCQEMRDKLDIEVVPVEQPRDAARGAHILAICTNSIRPVIDADWIEPGMHIANVTPWELDPEGYRKIDVAGLLVRRTPMMVSGLVDDDFGIRMNVMSYAAGTPEERAKIPVGVPDPDRYPNAVYVDCVDWETGRGYQRQRADEVTTLANASFGTMPGDAGPSAGLQGVQFAAVGGRIYERARELGLGTELPAEMFLQDIPT